MRAIIQRVSSASVTVGVEVVSRISEGLMVLVGLGTDDTPHDIEIITQKVYVAEITLTSRPKQCILVSLHGRLNIKAFADANSGGQWKASVMDRGGEILCVSQFTLFAKLNKNKPDFHKSMAPSMQPAESSSSMYAAFLERMGVVYDPAKIKDGKFGAMMSVALTNEGPITFIVDSRSEGMDSSLSDSPSRQPGSQSGTSGKSTTQPAPTITASQRAAEKALRKAAWEAAKKQTIQPKLDAPEADSSRGPDNTAQ